MARMEIITGVDRRRRWSDAEKLRILEEAGEPGARIIHVARRHDVLPQQIRRWRQQLFGDARRAASASVFVPVAIADTVTEAHEVFSPASRSSKAIAGRAEIRLRNGRVLKVAADMDRQVLASLIICVEAA